MRNGIPENLADVIARTLERKTTGDPPVAITRRRRLFLATGPAVVVFLVGALSFDGIRRTNESRNLVGHTRDVIARAHAVLATMQDAETGERGYVLTGAENYLEPYNRAVATLGVDTAALRSLARDNLAEQGQLDSIEALIRTRMPQLRETIDLRRSRGLDAAVRTIQTDVGKRTMDSIRLDLATLVGEEQAALNQHQTNEASRGRVVTLILVLGTLLAVGLTLLLNGTLVRHAETQDRLAAELERQNEQLQEQSIELETQAEELVDANRRLVDETRAAETAAATAEAANQAKSEFLAMMSHELRTPLNAISGYTQLMQLGVPEPPSAVARKYLDRIQHNQHQLLGVINSVLNLARVEAGTVAYDILDVRVAALLTAMEPLIAPQVLSRGHHYSCLTPDPTLAVHADPDKVTQILLNLLANAVKFTPDGGAITLSAERVQRPDGPVVAIRVRDTGTGVPPDKLSTIFDPFVQVESILRRSAGGAGLGLSISRNLARGMRGDLTVESALGVGSTFTLTLPPAGEPVA